MREPELARPDHPLGIVGALANPLGGRARMRSRKRLQQRNPFEVIVGFQLLLQPLLRPGIDRPRDLALLADRLGRAGPPVVEHLGVRGPRADPPFFRADAKSLRAVIRPDVAAPPEADAAYFALIPAPVGRDDIKPAVEVEVFHEQTLHALV